MRVTIAICTWNRAALLDRTLDQLGRLAAPPGVTWDLVVVNNNSPDDTEAVLDRHQGRLPLTRLFEPEQGLSNARNTALGAVSGDLIVWTDDDVLVPSTWLAAYCRAAAEYPEAGYFGGPIRPWFVTDPPAWVVRHLGRLGQYWALKDLGDTTRRLVGTETVFGANMAYRAAAIHGARFDPGRGHVGANFAGGEEGILQAGLRDRGWYGVWIPDAPVQHYLPADRLTTAYLWKIRSGIAEQDYSPASYRGRSIGSIPIRALRRYVRCRLAAAVHRPFRSRAWLEAHLGAAAAAGTIRAARRHARAARIVPAPLLPQ